MRRADQGAARAIRGFCLWITLWITMITAAEAGPSVQAVEPRPFGGATVAVTGVGAQAYRSFVVADPPRAIIDLRTTQDVATVVPDIKVVAIQGGWRRIVLPLDRPMVVSAAVLRDGDLTLSLSPADAARFAAAVALAPPAAAQGRLAAVRPPAEGPRLTIAIDPGHGGVDPGAMRAGVAEKDVALAFATALDAALRETGRYRVVLSRRDDRFVLLDDRVALARGAGADLFLSIHANTVTRGAASGAAVYVPASIPSDPESAALALLENRADRAEGAGDRGDDVTLALFDMARPVTERRAAQAADHIVAALRQSAGVIRSRPLRAADFRVLRAPDMPSILLELGFLSDDGDRANMTSGVWRATVAQAMVSAIDAWATADAGFLAEMGR